MSTKPGPAADIEPRSLWRRTDGTIVRVRDRVDGFVMLERGEEAWHFAFRMAHTPLYDRPALRSQFSMCLANLAEFRVFWNPAKGKIVARSLICARAFKLPAGVIEVGVYCAPFSPEEFLSDLDSCICRHDRTAERQAAAL